MKDCKKLDFLRVLDKETIDVDDFRVLVYSDIDDSAFEKLAKKARQTTLKRFGRVKGLYIPLYLSNYCDNACAYCGFSKDNDIARKTLTFDEIEAELNDIYSRGFRNVLFVSGECINFKNIQYFKKSIEIAKDIGFHSICVELGALPEDYCKILTKAGAESFTLYQETYHEPTYKKVHIKGLKTDYKYRLNGQARALGGGFHRVLFGFLCGLYDARFEAIEMFKHIKNIRKKYWEAETGISLPRITNAEGVDHEKYKIDDKLYARILMAFRLAFPDIMIALSTRENKNFRDGMSDICVTHLSVESKTMPGGYHSANEDDLEQFSVNDSRTLQEMIQSLKSKNYDICVKDWQSELNKK